MTPRNLLASIVALAGFGLLPDQASAQRDYVCYNDENGVRICGDYIPPEDARFDRDVINEQGIVLRREQGEITDEERAAIDAQRQAEEQALQEARDLQQYGQMLLDSYSSVRNIETMRDRMLEQIDGQITVIELYLNNLTRKLADLHDRSQRFAPYNESENAPPLPQNIALDIDRTESSIEMFRQRLEERHRDQEETRDSFEQDIAYYRQLTGEDA